MLHQELISIGKVRNAFDLDVSEVDEVIKNLRYNIQPYVFWHKAYEIYLKDIVEDKAQKHGIAIPEIFYESRDSFSVDAITSNILLFLYAIHPLASVYSMQDAIRYVSQESYDVIPEATYGWLRVFVDSIPFVASLENESYEYQIDLNKKFFSIEMHTPYLQEIIQDTFIIDKKSAVQYLVTCGYPFRQEVKGLSQGFFDYVTAQNFPISTNTTSHDAALSTNIDLSNLCIPRSLWEGKSNVAVRDALREEGFDDVVIAFVLFSWCGLQNKTQIGRLLMGSEKEDSSYRKYSHKLLEKAKTLNITTT